MQHPQHLNLPSSGVSLATGQEAVELCESTGLLLDPWQVFCLLRALAETELGEWAAFEVALILARQNGKNVILMARELAGLFLFHENLILHSAHEFKSADEAFIRIREHITNCDSLRRRVRAMPESHGEEGVELLPTPTRILGSDARWVTESREPRLRFLARTGAAARGFSGETVVWDEAFNLPSKVVSAQMPIMSAMYNPQLWYASSAVDQIEHDHGHTLARIRARGLSGSDAQLAYFEYQADERRYHEIMEKGNRRLLRAFLAEREQWAAANPAIGYRLSYQHTEREFLTMSARSFAVERLNIGDWPVVDDEATVIDMARWDVIADHESRPGDVISLGVDMSRDRKWVAIASSGRRTDGKLHVKVVDHRQGEAWLIDRLVSLNDRYDVCSIVLDPAGPVGSIIPSLVAAGIDMLDPQMPYSGGIVKVTAREFAQSCGALVDDVDEVADRLRHCGQPTLDDALRDAATRPLADAWAWSRKDSGGDISALVAVTLAAHGFRVHGSDRRVVPWVMRG